MYTNVVLGAISIAALAPLAHSAPAQAATRAFTPSTIPQIAPDPIKVVHRLVLTQPKEYRVRSGDTLSGISAKLYANESYWPRLYAANKGVVGNNPDMIRPGQELKETLADKPEYGSAVAAVNRARAVSAQSKQLHRDKYDDKHGECGDGDGDGMDAPCSEIFPHQQSSTPGGSTRIRNVGNVDVSRGNWPGGSYGACVVQRESGGNSQVMNSSGHYGLYQFSASTWAAYGGNPVTFGHASISEQEAVFMNAMAQGGQSNWSPYDGC